MKTKKKSKWVRLKQFKDLKFKNKYPQKFRKSYPEWADAKRAYLEFKNGYAVSVITGYGSYSDKHRPYEVAVMKDGTICYDTYITKDVVGYRTEREVSMLMIQIQTLPKRRVKYESDGKRRRKIQV